MKAIWSALAVGMLLWPLSARAQGYPGVMPAQSGYRPPVQSTAPQGAGGLGNPYGGTGANGDLGYYSAGGSDSEAAPAPEGVVISGNADDDDDDAQAHTGSAFQSLFKPAPKEDDGTTGNSIYDAVNANGSSAVERRRQAILRKIDADQRKAQRQMERANAAHAAEVRAMVQKTVDEQREKMNKENEDADESDDGGQDQGAVDQNQPAP